jgi:hypothetical protein
MCVDVCVINVYECVLASHKQQLVALLCFVALRAVLLLCFYCVCCALLCFCCVIKALLCFVVLLLCFVSFAVPMSPESIINHTPIWVDEVPNPNPNLNSQPQPQT